MPPVTRDVVLLVLGAAFLLIGLVGKISFKGVQVEASKPIRCILAVVGVALLVSGIFADNLFSGKSAAIDTPMKQPENISSPTSLPAASSGADSATAGITITQPPENGMVAGEAEVAGSYGPSISEDIWVIVWPEKSPGKGWPQSDDAARGLPCAKQDGRWIVHCVFGGPSQKYKIAAYTATPAASNSISTDLRKWYKEMKYAGISRASLPRGLKEQCVIVVRKGL